MAKKAKKAKKKTKKRSRKRTADAVRQPEHYEIESAADTLYRASEINANPNLKRRAKAALRKRQKIIARTIGR